MRDNNRRAKRNALRDAWEMAELREKIETRFAPYDEEGARAAIVDLFLSAVERGWRSPYNHNDHEAESMAMNRPPVLPTVLDRICDRMAKRHGPLPFKHRGIRITRDLIRAAAEILNATPDRTLPQHCRNARREYTPDGFDRRIKERLNDDTRTANIVSDVLEEAGVVEVLKVENPATGRMVKATKLVEEWSW